jgi:L-asparaginase II
VRPSVQLVRVIRSGLQESVHLGDVAVCDQDGRVVASAGEPARPVFARSCMKPIQAAVCLREIAEELPPRELAVMCSSHNGEAEHVRAVLSLLRRAGLTAASLLCPPSYPLDAASMACSKGPRRELSDCSGKHAGMLLACRRSGWDPASYPERGHRLQRRIRRAVLRASGLETVAIGVDGCGVPVHAMPLSSLATVYARLTTPATLGDLELQARACVEAMLAEPYMVGGRDRVDTAVMGATGDVVAKAGAEGLYCTSLMRSGLGVALKVADGGSRAGRAALIRVLRQLDALSSTAVRDLRPYARPPVLGGGRPVGALVAEANLRHR